MEIAPLNYVTQKKEDSGHALLEAASLPYESFSERSGVVVPGPTPGPESQLTDIINTDAVVDPNLQGYLEISNELVSPLRMSKKTQMLPISSNPSGRFLFQFEGNQTTLPYSSFLEVESIRSIMVEDSNIPFDVVTGSGPNNPMALGVTVTRRTLSRAIPFFVNLEYTTGGGVWTVANATPNYLFNGTSGAFSASLPVTCLGVRVSVRAATPFDGSSQLALDVSIEVSGGTYRFPYQYSTLQSYVWPFLSQLPVTEMFRRIACDGLFTWTGSTLDNGGKISCALVPESFCPSYGDPYQSVASQRFDRMDGPAKNGAHGTWRSTSLRELDRLNVMNYVRANRKISMGYNFATADGSARIRVFGMFGFTSQNPVIGRMVWTPAVTPSMVEALGIYYHSYPACTCNRQHALLKSFRKAASTAGSIIDEVLKHDDVLAALATSMGSPEGALAIRAAGAVNRKLGRAASKKKQKKRAEDQAPVKPKRIRPRK